MRDLPDNSFAVTNEMGCNNAPLVAQTELRQHDGQSVFSSQTSVSREVQQISNYSTSTVATPDKTSICDTIRKINIQLAAFRYAQSGKPVFPCNSNKAPSVFGGFKSASKDYDTIVAWSNKYPNALIGIPTGKASGLFVLDVDVKSGVNGFDTLAALEEQYGALPPTLTVKTPSGGEHRYFVMPETEVPLKNSVGLLGAGLDTRGEGGYVIAPPSLHSSGISYQYVDRSIEPAELPLWMIDFLKKPKAVVKQVSPKTILSTDSTSYGKTERNEIVAEMANALPGQRNDTLNRMAFRLGVLVRDDQINGPDSHALIQAAIAVGLTEKEVHRTFKSGFEAGLESPDTEASVATVATVAAFTKEKNWPEPQPLELKTEALPYPIDALPDTIKAAVNEVHAFVKAAVAMVASSAIGALSLAVQGHIDVARTNNLKSPVGLFILTIADSGERKSTCDKFFGRAFREYEGLQKLKAAPLLLAYEAELIAWEAKLSGIKDKIKTSKRSGRDTSKDEHSLQELMGEKPEPPKVPRMLYADSTPEALGYSLAKT